MTADSANAIFEGGGALLLLLNIRCLLRDKKVVGISLAPVLFWTLWGYWNLFYYPHLGQWWSFVGGLGVVAANTVWLGLAWKYRNN